ncbi:MAG: hypothetical protein ACYTG1_09875 [Planctomycetota bacterium]|jgi:hypothetical protein
MVMCRNLTGRDIDDIRGGFRVTDADGTVLHATGLTPAIPNDLLVAAGEEFENSPFGLNRKQDVMDRLATAPEELTFSFVARDVTFMD